MHYKTRTLENGLTILGAPIKDSPTTTLLVLVKVGARYESLSQRGISHFLEHMMFKGTRKRPNAQAIAVELDSIGASYNAFTGHEYTGYWIKVRNKQVPQALDIIADIFQNSQFNQKDIAVERGAIMEELKMYQDMPMRSIRYTFQELMYPDSPLGRNIIGTPETIQSFTQADFQDYFHTKYVAGNTIIAAAGEVTTGLMDAIEQTFTSVRHTEVPVPEKAQEHTCTEPQVTCVNKPSDQSHLVYGFHIGNLYDTSSYTTAIASMILGGYMSSRLFREIREKRGYAYYVGCSQRTFEDTGYMVISAGVKDSKVEDSLKIIRKQLREIQDYPVTEQEIQIAKEQVKARMAMSFESSDEVAETIAAHALWHSEPFNVDTEIAAYDAVTKADIQQIMTQFAQPEQGRLAVIGSWKEKDSIRLKRHLVK